MDKCIKRVLSLPQLTPSEEVNAAFTELVNAVVAHGEEPLLYDENRRHQVQQRCAVAEGELERHWSGRITEADNPWVELGEFPYHENYKELTRREIGLLGRAGLWLCDSSEVAMIGSGPLPLTGWWLHQLTGARTLLYPGFDAHAFEGVQLMEEYHPTDDIINSVFVCKPVQ